MKTIKISAFLLGIAFTLGLMTTNVMAIQGNNGGGRCQSKSNDVGSVRGPVGTTARGGQGDRNFPADGHTNRTEHDD